MCEMLANYLNQFSERLNIEIDFFIEQINTNLNYISAYDRFIKNNEQFINVNPVNQAEFFQLAYDLHHSSFPYLVNSSLLITFDSYFDDKFFKLTEQTSLILLNKFHVKNANGTYIYKCFDYFCQELDIDLLSKNSTWISLKHNHRIRNLIVHHNSCLLENIAVSELVMTVLKIKTHKEYDIIHNCKFINLNELTGKFYITDNDFLICYLEDVRAFLIKVIELIKAKMNL